MWNENYTCTQILLLHYLVKSKWLAVQLYSTVNSVQSEEKCLITVSVHDGCYYNCLSHTSDLSREQRGLGKLKLAQR